MTGSRNFFRGYGLTIDSAFAIPGAAAVAPDRPDIVIASGSTAINRVEAVNGPYCRSRDALLLDVPGVARFLAPGPAELRIEPHAGADPEDVSALLIATALPMLLWMRGGIVLHAAGVVMPGNGGAIALAGPSGTGKSTLSHRLVEAGGRLVGDDSLLVTVSDAAASVSGLCASCYLPGPSNEKRNLHPIPATSQIESATLGAVVVLVRMATGASAPPAQLTGTAALEVLLQNRHRPRVPAIMGLNAALMPDFAALVRSVPVYRLEIPDGDPVAAQARVEALADDLE